MTKCELEAALEEAKQEAKDWEESWGICSTALTAHKEQVAIYEEREEITRRILTLEDKHKLHLIYVYTKALLEEDENNQM